jgi:hypothetical protein
MSVFNFLAGTVMKFYGQRQRKTLLSEKGGVLACRVSAATAAGRQSKGAWEFSAAPAPLQQNG